MWHSPCYNRKRLCICHAIWIHLAQLVERPLFLANFSIILSLCIFFGVHNIVSSFHSWCSTILETRRWVLGECNLGLIYFPFWLTWCLSFFLFFFKFENFPPKISSYIGIWLCNLLPKTEQRRVTFILIR